MLGFFFTKDYGRRGKNSAMQAFANPLDPTG